MEKSSFHNSINGDRKYSAQEFVDYFGTLISSGVMNKNDLSVIAGAGRSVVLKAGVAYINGRRYENDTDLVIPLNIADGVLKRIDRIVLQYSKTAREIKAVVRSSTPASTPIAPVLQRNADYWELCVADVLVNAGAISISQSNITDQRLNNSVCGIVTGIITQIDTTAFYNQIQTALKEFKENEMQSFADWFETVKGNLSEDTAGNLFNLIEKKLDKVGGTISGNLNVIGTLQKSGANVITTAGGTITGSTNFSGSLTHQGNSLIPTKIKTIQLTPQAGLAVSSGLAYAKKTGNSVTIGITVSAPGGADATAGFSFFAGNGRLPVEFRPTEHDVRCQFSVSNGALVNSAIGTVNITKDGNIGYITPVALSRNSYLSFTTTYQVDNFTV